MVRPNYQDLPQGQLVTLLQTRDRKKSGLVWGLDAIKYGRALKLDFAVLVEVTEGGAGDSVKSLIIKTAVVDRMFVVPGRLFCSTQLPTRKLRGRRKETLCIDACKLGPLIDRVPFKFSNN